MEQEGVVIIGAGHAGGSVAALLRQGGYGAPIVIIGDETVAPYQRPPLSKAWLKGDADADALVLRPESFYREHDITLRLAARVTRIDRDAQHVTLGNGESIGYSTLVLATGARARQAPLAGADQAGVLVLRTMTDADRLKTYLRPGRRVAVIGGGYVGLEAAASARALGSDVVVIERAPRVLARVASEDLSKFFQNYHEKHGVRFILDATITDIVGLGGHASAVRLAGNGLINADAILIGVGAVPNDELAFEAGLRCDDGIIVDNQARTSDPSIFAIGDCTRRPIPIYGNSLLRLESVPSALEQARLASAAILEQPKPPDEIPWFWSDQYDLKLQIAGLPLDVVETVVRGDMASGKFAVFHLDATHRLQAVEAINSPPEFMGGRILIGQRKIVSPERLRDPSISMKEVVA